MDWINGLINIHSALQGVIIVSLVCAAGLALGKIRFAGVFFRCSICVSSLVLPWVTFGLNIDAQMLNYCETFGLVLFVYTLGLHVGPNFLALCYTKVKHRICGP